jgi:hypothetical protein
MKRSLSLAGLGLVVVLVIAGTLLGLGVGGPRSSPTLPAPTIAATVVAPTPTAPPTASPVVGLPALDATFVSPWYGFSVAYPSTWKVTNGEGPWPWGLALLLGNPHLDAIQGVVGTGAAQPGEHQARISGASIDLQGGSLADFMAFASGGSCAPVEPLREPVMIGGSEATVTLNGCASLADLGGSIWDMVLVAGGRGYDFTIDGWITAAEAQAWLDTIVLDPGAAPASPSSTGS